MKRIKKAASFALAMALAATMPMTAFAAPNETGEGTENTAQAAMTVDENITVSGLQENDGVTFYQVLKWDNGWVPTDAFAGVLSDDELQGLVKGEVTETGTTGSGGITFEMAGKLGAAVSSAPAYSDAMTAQNGSVIINGPDAGLYMAIITPGQPGYTYNPVFVAADFSRANNNGVIDLSDGSLGYKNKGNAKVNKIDLTKTADSITSDLGDVINFEVKTAIPLYASNYVKPVFRLNDALSEGLTLDASTIVVTDANGGVIDAANYDLTSTDVSYVIDFHEDYLRSLGAVTDITVNYSAEVTDMDTTSINPEDNTVTANFSNRPDDTTGFGILRDRTNHYTFDIDGVLFGENEYTASEVIKIGVDADGNEITDHVTLDNGKWAGALEGAKFTLYADESLETVYKNSQFDGTELVSGEKGHITLKGLDAGTYYLVETEAPAGYIKSQEPVVIEISYTTDTVKVTDVENVDGKDVEVIYEVEVLNAYTVKVNGVVTGSYTLTNQGADLESVNKGDLVGDESLDGKIKNTVGVELPSTGGIGTTIFYITGAVLVIGAGVTLVAKKRMKDGNDE